MSYNYTEEQKKLEAYKPIEGSLFWKPTAGKYKVKAMTELEEAEPYEDKPQVKIVLNINGEDKIWTFGHGKTPASVYGQFVRMATENNNTLIGKEFTVVVINDGTKNSYTLV